jgi:hypothetical protein
VLAGASAPTATSLTAPPAASLAGEVLGCSCRTRTDAHMHIRTGGLSRLDHGRVVVAERQRADVAVAVHHRVAIRIHHVVPVALMQSEWGLGFGRKSQLCAPSPQQVNSAPHLLIIHGKGVRLDARDFVHRRDHLPCKFTTRRNGQQKQLTSLLLGPGTGVFMEMFEDVAINRCLKSMRSGHQIDRRERERDPHRATSFHIADILNRLWPRLKYFMSVCSLRAEVHVLSLFPSGERTPRNA